MKSVRDSPLNACDALHRMTLGGIFISHIMSLVMRCLFLIEKAI